MPVSQVRIAAGDLFPEVSIVILNWNGKLFLQQFLPSVLNSSYPRKRIIIADNGSTDDSVAFLKLHFPSVEILESPVNEGYAKGYNTALKQIQSDYYVLLNSDIEVTPGWIESIISLMQMNTKIAACQPKILSYTSKDSFEYAGASGGWIDSLGYPFARGRVFDTCEKDMGQYDDARPCFWASGAALFIRPDCFFSVGGFDEYFFAHQEEIDLCWRLQRAGYCIYVQPASTVYHVGGGTLPKENKLKTYLNFRNNLVMLCKNYPVTQKGWKIFIRLVLDGVSAIKFLADGHSNGFFAVLKAHRHFFYWLFFKKKSKNKPGRQQPDKAVKYNGLIVWDYFIAKKRTFSEITASKK